MKDCLRPRQSMGDNRGYVQLMETTPSKVTPFARDAMKDKGKGIATSSQGRIKQQCSIRSGQARVFTLILCDAQASNAVVTGMLYVYGIEVLVLFDPKSTHSFVSPPFVSRLNLCYYEMKKPLIVN